MPVVADHSSTPVSEKDEWRTDPNLFMLLDREFKFDLDAAATVENALCPLYFTKDDDALSQDWYKEGVVESVYCNPPYSLAGEFLQKGREEADKGARCVFLVRGDLVETKWFRGGVLDFDYAAAPYLYQARYHIRFLTPRAQFLRPNGEPVKGVMWTSAIIVMTPYRSSLSSGTYWWEWKKELDDILSTENSQKNDRLFRNGFKLFRH